MTVMVRIIFFVPLLISVEAQSMEKSSSAIKNCCDLGFRPSAFSEEVAYNSGQYQMKNFCSNDLSTITKVYCDTETDGGGWLVIQRRIDGSVDFNRDWTEYEEGFGTLPVDDKDTTREFWIGLYPLHCLTGNGRRWELRIDYMLTNGTRGYLSYSVFKVGSADEQYPLTISGFEGSTTDPFAGDYSLTTMPFTTKDRDNDKSRRNCAATSQHGRNAGGWWYKSCSYIHLNHQYNNKHNIFLNGRWHALPHVEMKIRPLNCVI
ncbi:fibrinogen-like protein A [Dysidea avara]|uniref:fibrinogen-like protein A n=1 Tax=Dysidea avara TaxID=196820 RepID=UPI0033287F71